MKHAVILGLFLLLCSLPLQAQKNLNISSLFNGQYRNKEDATEVLMKGRKLVPYKLSLFRSLTLNTGTVNVSQIEKMVKADGAKAIDKEVGSRSGRLYYAFYQLKPSGENCRYLFYRNNSLQTGNGKKNTLTVIYMEGTATIEELKRTFAR